MTTTPELKLRFHSAFRLYAAQTTRLLQLQVSSTESEVSLLAQMDQQRRTAGRAERSYRAARLEYAQHLLSSR
jgi:hypothetical protein